ncbi:MAG: hypothetical protein ACR2FI_09410 [Burkholderiales bacterium]
MRSSSPFAGGKIFFVFNGETTMLNVKIEGELAEGIEAEAKH